MPDPTPPASRRFKQLVIVGGGFGGLQVARELAGEPLSITLIDRRNHHLFQPLLHQVATGTLAADDVAIPLRTLLRKNPNTRVLMGEVSAVDLDGSELSLEDGTCIRYDYLVLSVGSRADYFGHPEWGRLAPDLTSLDSALRMRERVLRAFEGAERAVLPEKRRRLLRFVVVGAGPTGVELAGGLSELRRYLAGPRRSRPCAAEVEVVLADQAKRVLPTFHRRTSRDAQRLLGELGVEVRLGTRVDGVGARGVSTSSQMIESALTCWAGGVRPVPLMQTLDADLDGRGAAIVEQDCALPGRPDVFVIGDSAAFRPPGQQSPLPALAAVAIQQGAAVADNIARDLSRRPRRSFEYRDRGKLALVGWSRGVGDFGSLQVAGASAFWLWLLVHLYYLSGAHSRIKVLLDWAFRYLAPERRTGAGLITERELPDVIGLQEALARDDARHTTWTAEPSLLRH